MSTRLFSSPLKILVIFFLIFSFVPAVSAMCVYNKINPQHLDYKLFDKNVELDAKFYISIGGSGGRNVWSIPFGAKECRPTEKAGKLSVSISSKSARYIIPYNLDVEAHGYVEVISEQQAGQTAFLR